MIINTSKLRKEYSIADMAYLDTAEASVLYKCKANIIKDNGLTGVVDVGCRIGIVNEFLKDYNYNYYGFDTSSEPLEYAREQYKPHTFDLRSWEDLQYPEFDVDVVIFGSVLIYDKDPYSMFERICSFYKPKHAIIHEVDSRNTEELNYTDLSYFYKNYNISSTHRFNLNIPVGKRTIIDVEYKQL